MVLEKEDDQARETEISFKIENVIEMGKELSGL